MRGDEELVVGPEGLEGVHQQEGLDGEGEGGVEGPADNPGAGLGQLQLGHRLPLRKCVM